MHTHTPSPFHPPTRLGHFYVKTQVLDLDNDERLIERTAAEEEEDMSEAAGGMDVGGGSRVGGAARAGVRARISEQDREFVREMLVPAYLAAAGIEPLRKPGVCARVDVPAS